MWAPLMAELVGFRLLAVDLPGYGLTDTTENLADNLRHNAVSFLDGVLEVLGLEASLFVANSLGSLWSSWLALDRPQRVTALVHVGCADLLPATERLPGFRQTFLSTLNALLRLRGNRPETRLTARQLAQTDQPTLAVLG